MKDNIALQELSYQFAVIQEAKQGAKPSRNITQVLIIFHWLQKKV